MASQRGGKRPGAGIKKGTELITQQMRFDILQTLRARGFDPLQKILENYDLCVELLNEARAGYENEYSPIRKVNHWLVNSRVQMVQNASFELMKYVYPQRKAIELTGAGGEDLFKSFVDMVKEVHEDVTKAQAIETQAERLPNE